MATLLTLVETPSAEESCGDPDSSGGAEALSRELVTGRESGVSEAGIAGLMDKGYPLRRGWSRGRLDAKATYPFAVAGLTWASDQNGTKGGG